MYRILAVVWRQNIVVGLESEGVHQSKTTGANDVDLLRASFVVGCDLCKDKNRSVDMEIFSGEGLEHFYLLFLYNVVCLFIRICNVINLVLHIYNVIN